MVSVVLRQTILPLVTPDELRGRVNAVEMVFISASNELGAFESGVAAALDRRGACRRRSAGCVDDRRRGCVVAGLPGVAPGRSAGRPRPSPCRGRLELPASVGESNISDVTPRIEASSISTGWQRRAGRSGPARAPRRPGRGSPGLRSRSAGLAWRARARPCGPRARAPPRLREVVDPGRAAAELLLGRLDDLEPGIRRASVADAPAALGVAEVAGVLEATRELERMLGLGAPRGARRRRARRRRARSA